MLYNNDIYDVTIMLMNDGGVIQIPESIIRSISFYTDLSTSLVTGSLVYSDEFDVSERMTVKDEPYTESMFFKCDGTDLIHISIGEHGVDPVIDSMFSITNTGTPDSDISNNMKIISFTDRLSHELRKSNIDVNSATIGRSGKVLSNLDNDSRNAKISDILKSIATSAYPDVTFNIDTDSANDVFYNTLSSDTGIDAMNAMLPKFLGSDNTFGVIKYNITGGSYTLTSLGDLIRSYDDVGIEQYRIPDVCTIHDEVISTYKSPRYSVYVPRFNDIDSYEYGKVSPIQNIDNNVNRSVATYNNIDQTFKVFNQDISIQATTRSYNNGIVQPIQGGNIGDTAHPLLAISSDRLTGVNTKEMYILNKTNIYQHKANALRDMVFLNDAISFNAVGVLDRKVGDLIEIVSPKMENGRWANRIYGIWMVLTLSHTFNGGEFNNSIYAVKLSTNRNLELYDEVR